MELRDRPLFEAQESLRIIADRIDIGLFKTNASGQIDFVNNAACQFLGFIVKDETRLKLPESGSIIFGTQWEKIVKEHWAKAWRGEQGDFQIDHDRGRVLHINYYPIKNGEYLGTELIS